jgi:hypothetical protein
MREGECIFEFDNISSRLAGEEKEETSRKKNIVALALQHFKKIHNIDEYETLVESSLNVKLKVLCRLKKYNLEF